MKTPKQWMDEFDPAWGDELNQPTELTEERVKIIQEDVLAGQVAGGEELGRSNEEYRNINAAYQQLSDSFAAANLELQDIDDAITENGGIDLLSGAPNHRSAAIRVMRTRLDDLEADAKRYRFLRMRWDDWTGNSWSGTAQSIAYKLDCAIDTAMRPEPEQGQGGGEIES